MAAKKNALESALGFVEKGAHAKAIDSLITSWRNTRSPEIAAAVDALDRAGASDTIAADTWAKAAKTGTDDAVTRGVLIRSIASMTMAQMTSSLKIAEKWDDPRVATVLITMLEELRSSGRRSHNFWRDEVFARMARLADPRFLALHDTLPKKWAVGMKSWLENRLEETTSEIVAAPALPKADAAILAKIVAAATKKPAEPAGRAGTSKSVKSGDALLAAIYETPTDDSARAVYADWLIERNDPRGEFIALQLRADSEKDRAAKKQENALFAKNKNAWLGKIQRMVGSGAYGTYPLTFRRGFVATGAVKFRNEKDVKEFGSLPEWSTLEDVYWGALEVDDDDAEWARWIGPAFKHVKIARQPMAKHLLASQATKYAIEILELEPESCSEEEFRQLLVSPNLPALRRAHFTGVTKPSALSGVKKCPPELCFNASIDDDDIPGYIKAAESTNAKVLMFDQYGGLEHRFTRDKSGKLTRLDTEIRPPSKVKSLTPTPSILTDFIKELAKLKVKLTHFDAKIEVAGELVPATAAIEAAKKKLS